MPIAGPDAGCSESPSFGLAFSTSVRHGLTVIRVLSPRGLLKHRREPECSQNKEHKEFINSERHARRRADKRKQRGEGEDSVSHGPRCRPTVDGGFSLSLSFVFTYPQVARHTHAFNLAVSLRV